MPVDQNTDPVRAQFTPEDILRDPAASFWLKNSLHSALAGDPVDSANDVEVLARLLEDRCRSRFAS